MKLRPFSESQECLNVTRMRKFCTRYLGNVLCTVLCLATKPLIGVAVKNILIRNLCKRHQWILLMACLLNFLSATRYSPFFDFAGRKPFLDDKKSNKSFSYSRHAQNYEHFLLPFPSFSNQSCLLIQLFSSFSSSSFWHQGRSLLRRLKRGIPNCQTHHVRRSSPISQFLHTWLDFFFCCCYEMLPFPFSSIPHENLTWIYHLIPFHSFIDTS